jgi:flagellar protein FlaG
MRIDSSVPLSQIQNRAKEAAAGNEPIVLEKITKPRSKIAESNFAIHSSATVMEALEQLNQTTEAIHVSLRFRLHEDSARFMVQVVDVNENQVIKEIPPEAVLNLVARIQDMIGLLINEKR